MVVEGGYKTIKQNIGEKSDMSLNRTKIILKVGGGSFQRARITTKKAYLLGLIR